MALHGPGIVCVVGSDIFYKLCLCLRTPLGTEPLIRLLFNIFGSGWVAAFGRFLTVATGCFVADCGWSFFSRAELCPFRHQCPALLQKIGA